MNRIIVPTDFSECALNALKVAASVARISNAQLLVVHWFFPNSLSYVNAKVYQKKNVEDEKKVDESMQKLLSDPDLDGVNISPLILKEIGIDGFVEHPEVEQADLIIMGTQGTSNLKEVLLGSNAQKVIRHAKPPVLAIKNAFDISNITSIIIASGFNNDRAIQAYDKIRSFASATNVKIHLLKIITPSFFEDSEVTSGKMDHFIEQAKVSNYEKAIYNHYSPEEGITAYASQSENSIISIVTKGYSGLSLFLNGSTAEELVNKLNRPILSIKV